MSLDLADLGEESLAKEIATRATAEVDAFFAGHTHQAENCVVTDPAGQPAATVDAIAADIETRVRGLLSELGA